MVFKEIVEIFNWFLEITTFIEDCFGNFDKGTLFVSDYCCSSRHIIDQRNLSEGISGVIENIFLLSSIFLILTLHAVNSFQNDIVILSFVTFSKQNLMHIMMLYLQMHCHLLKRRQFCVKRFFNENDFLDRYNCTFKILTSS